MGFCKVRENIAPDGLEMQTGKQHAHKWEDRMIIILTIIVNVALMSTLFDFYYDLNDDVLMKDIMAGVYSGTPEGHNMQTLYILGAFIALCYRLCRSIPWYGLFLFLCQMGSLYLIGVRLLHFCGKGLEKAGIAVLLTMFIWGTVLPHMVALQYTITCSMLAGAALFLFMTTEGALTVKQFIIKNLPAVFLVILAYQLRTEMLLLVFPLICLAGLFRWLEEEKFFQMENYYRYGVVIGLILAGMLLSSLLDTAAYGSKEWRAFREFFDNRTQVYDFHLDVVTSGEHKEYLYSIGLGDASQELLANYNFGLDEEIDEKVLGEIAAYAAGESTVAGGSAAKLSLEEWMKLLLRRGREYLYRTLAGGDAPYNRLALCGYACVAFVGIYDAFLHRKRRRKWKFAGELMLLGIVRTGLWMFILMNGRDPERITHSLYFVETMLLMGLLCMRLSVRENGQIPVPAQTKTDDPNAGKAERVGCLGCALLTGLFCLCYLPHNISAVSTDMETRAEANRGAEAIAKYCKAHPDNFYFEDVYSTVGFSQKIFKNIDNSFGNYDIMGGWICKSPLYKEKLSQFGIETMEEGLLEDSGVFFIMDMEMQDSSTDWMRAYYEEKGIAVEIVQIDLIGERYAVYRVGKE